MLNPEDVFEDADAVVLATDRTEYRRLPWKKLTNMMENTVVLDGRNFLNPEQMTKYGYG